VYDRVSYRLAVVPEGLDLNVHTPERQHAEIGELVVVDGTMKSTDYIDIRDRNLLYWVANIIGDVTIPFIFQHDNGPVHTARNVQTWLDQHDV
jgi:hypothetical protein